MHQPVGYLAGVAENHVQEDACDRRGSEAVGGIPKAGRLETSGHLFRVEGGNDIAGVGVEHLELLDSRLTAAEVGRLKLVY